MVNVDLNLTNENSHLQIGNVMGVIVWNEKKTKLRHLKSLILVLDSLLVVRPWKSCSATWDSVSSILTFENCRLWPGIPLRSLNSRVRTPHPAVTYRQFSPYFLQCAFSSLLFMT